MTSTRRPLQHVKLFCFPHAGGSSAYFRNWQAALPDWIELICVEYPGRGRRYHDPLVHSVDKLADLLAAELKNQLQSPFAFYGHSLGGLVARELCWRLENTNVETPIALSISAAKPPHLPRNQAAWLPESEADLLEYLESQGGTPIEILRNSEMLEAILKVIRADLSVLDSVRCENIGILRTPLFVYGGSADTSVNLQDLVHWQDLAENVNFSHFEGGHFFFSDSLTRFLSALSGDILEVLKQRVYTTVL